ncbi:hypothetical protein ACW7G2_06340 [Luteimonas sp. A277]
MRRFITLSGLILLLAGCGADQPAAPASQGGTPTLESTTPRPAQKPIAGDPVDQGLENLQKMAASTVRYDRIRTLEDGTKQRQVFVEMLGATAEDTHSSATQIFEKGGFTVRTGLMDENGIRVQYRKTGVEPISALIRSAEGGPPLNDPAATSSFYIRQSVD